MIKLMIVAGSSRLFLFTGRTNAIDNHLNIFNFIAGRQDDVRRDDIIQADGGQTAGADKMNMVIMMMAFAAIFAQCILHGIIGSGNSVYDALFHEGLQRAVDRNTVELFSGFLFNITMCQCILAV